MSAQASQLVALHSSTDCLAVGLQPLSGSEPPQVRAFPLGRQLSGALLPCLEQLLPAERWPEIGRLVVATGPGGFTSTRLTVVLARTLAQQLAVPLHGFCSFLPVALRLLRQRPELAEVERFWLIQDLPRRGTVAGCYGADPASLGAMAELQPPRLFLPGEAFAQGLVPALILPAAVEAPLDILELLALGQAAAAQGLAGPWQPVLPIYPTSPVDVTPQASSQVPTPALANAPLPSAPLPGAGSGGG
jgi:tRNA threonylcarbamoyl adenosine modification protein YeaZ